MALSKRELDECAERNEQIELTEECEVLHRGYLSEFEQKVWPIFRQYGYAHDTALTVWMLEKVNDNLLDIKDILEEEL